MSRVEHWDPAWGPLNEKNMRQRLQGEGYHVQSYRYPAGTYFSEHTHKLDKKDAVLTGKLQIETDDETFLLERGDILEIPAGCSHSAEVVGAETVLSLDATRIARG